MYIEFTGKTAHAGNYLWKGRSALDAVEIFLHGVNMMREHGEPTARIHYIIKDGRAIRKNTLKKDPKERRTPWGLT